MKNRGFNAGGDGIDRVFRALGDPHRIQITELLKEKELSAGEILQAIDIVQSTVSHHMKTLTDSGVVNAVRHGKWTYYSLNQSVLDEAADYLQKCAEGTRIMRKDTDLPDDMEEDTAAPRADKPGSGNRAKDSAKAASARVIQSKAAADEKQPVKSTSKNTEKTSSGNTAKTLEKDAEKTGKKKDKKGKKNKKNKK